MESFELPNNVLERVPNPIVSIRTSTYNHEKYIAQCIESVLAQKTTFPFEYIIGEDCSTDGTRKIVERYASQHPDLIRVITSRSNVGMKENGGRCNRASRGKYTAICEGDDYWTDPLKLQRQIEFLEKNPHVMICGHAVKQIDTEGRVISESKFGIHKDLWLSPEELAFQLWNIPHLSVVYRRTPTPPSHLRVLNGDTLRCAWFANHGWGFIFKDVMGVHRVHPGGVWSRLDKSKQIDRNLETWTVIPTVLKPELKPIAYLRLFLSSLSYKRPSKATYALLMLLKTIRPQYIPGLIRISRKISAKMIFKRWKRFSSHFPWTSRGK